MPTTKTKSLEALFLDGLKDIYYAEKQILKALPKMAKGAESEEVRAAFEKHQMETEEQVSRLEQVFEILGEPASGKTCPAIDGTLIAWAEQLGMNDAVDLLQATLEEEVATDEALTELGEGGVNERALDEAA